MIYRSPESDPSAGAEQEPVLPEACAVFRGALSEYIDGQMTDEARRVADVHVAACRPCRQLADEVEAVERTLAQHMDEDTTEPLPAGFAGSILARTVHESDSLGRVDGSRRVVPGGHGMVPWLGWVAAAALIVFNLTLWNVDPPAPGPAIDTSGERISAQPAAWQVSATLDGPATPRTIADRPDLAPLYAAATLLESFADATLDPDGAGDFAREVIAYDDLLPRLAAIARTLPQESAATVELSRGVLEALAEGDSADRRHLQRQLADGDLAGALRRLEVRLRGPA